MKNKTHLVVKVVLLCFATCFASSCGSMSTSAAEINGRKISRAELELTITELADAGQTPIVDGEIDGETVRGVLSALVQGIGTEQFLKENGEEISTADRNTTRAKVMQDTDTSTYTQHLKDLIIELNSGVLALERVKAPDAKKAAEMYAKAPASLGVLCLRHLLVETEATATEALKKFNDGAEFATVAGQYSIEPNVEKSGGALTGADNACITLTEYQSNFDTDFTAGALRAKAGVAFGPVKSSFGYHIIYVRPFIEVAEDISKLLNTSAGVNLLTGFIATSKIKIDSAYGFWNPARGGVVAN
ncbi:MAG: peptidylprolyl isomerase [Actinobacteria bacterium]|nr:peptidylprolyl isomerase [Actinomycetota bacterium]